MSKYQFLLVHLVLIVISGVIILYLFPSTHHTGGMYLPVSKEETESRANALLDSLRLDTTELQSSTSIRLNGTLYTRAYREFGLSRGNALLRDGLPGFHWDIRWRTTGGITALTAAGEDVDMSDLTWRTPGIRIRYDGHGNLIQFQFDIADTVYVADAGRDSARAIAEDFLARFTHHNPENLSLTSQDMEVFVNRSDHIFQWEGDPDVYPFPYIVSVRIAGSIVSQYRTEFVPDAAPAVPTTAQKAISSLSSIVPYILIAIMMLVIGVKRFRSQEIGYKNGVIISIIAALIIGLSFYLQEFIHEMGWERIFPLLFGPLFIGVFILFIVVVSEAIGRNTWKEKFIPFDLVSNGYIFHSEAGKSYIRGITYGIAALAVSLILVRAVDAVYPVWYSWAHETNPLEYFSPPYAALKLLLYDVWVELIGFTMLLVFLLSYLRQRISNVYILIIVAAILYGIGDWRYTYPSFPIASGLLIASMYGALFVWIMYRFDIVTGYLSVFTFSIAGAAATMLLSGNDFYITEGVIIFAVLGLLVATGGVSQFTRDKITDFEAIAPVFQKYISERERLQRELEIAHDVQMSFLPKKTPDIPGLDIASICIPAHEVGGDYYDFIRIDDNLFGVVIGDVSGKGTRASFYMTLTKGILRSTARNATHPAEVLKTVNRIFYECAERGAFISMVYGIFNLKDRMLTVARAGHNPVILWKSAQANGNLINPEGIALGLDDGTLFDSSVRESSVRFEPDDLFIFYTDGFSEAVNKRNEEFGDRRLFDAAQAYNRLPAKAVLDGIVAETNNFTGRTPQRDDMTMVIVKVTHE